MVPVYGHTTKNPRLTWASKPRKQVLTAVFERLLSSLAGNSIIVQTLIRITSFGWHVRTANARRHFEGNVDCYDLRVINYGWRAFFKRPSYTMLLELNPSSYEVVAGMMWPPDDWMLLKWPSPYQHSASWNKLRPSKRVRLLKTGLMHRDRRCLPKKHAKIERFEKKMAFNLFFFSSKIIFYRDKHASAWGVYRTVAPLFGM